MEPPAAAIATHYPGLDPGPLPTLDEAIETDLHHLETERLKRDLAAMLAMDAAVTKSIRSNTHVVYTTAVSTETTSGAVKLQSWWRQLAAQRKLAMLMMEKFEADDARRRLREQRLVEDTLQLLDRLALQNSLANEAYLTKCRKNHQNRVAYSIQCLYRRHSAKKRPTTAATSFPLRSFDATSLRPESS